MVPGSQLDRGSPKINNRKQTFNINNTTLIPRAISHNEIQRTEFSPVRDTINF